MLRVVRNGLEVKRTVDDAIDRTSATFNLRDAIDDYRNLAEEAKSPQDRNRAIERGELRCMEEADARHALSPAVLPPHRLPGVPR